MQVSLHCYRRSEEENGRVFAPAAFEQWLSTGDFPLLPLTVRENFPSLGIHPLLPYVLKHFGYAAIDPVHPARALLLDNYEKEWAWSVGCAFMAEVCVQGRVFLQPDKTMTFLARLGPYLPLVPPHPLGRGLPPISWTLDSVVSLMTQVSEVSVCNHHHWPDFTTGTQSPFLLYNSRMDAFACRLAATPGSAGPRGRRGGVGSGLRRTRRKQYRDLDAVTPPPAMTGVNLFHSVSPRGSNERAVLPAASGAIPPMPPLEGPSVAATPGVAVRDLSLSRDDIASVPKLAQALGPAGDRAWTVGCLLSTMASWFLARTDEARRLNGERDSLSLSLRRWQSESNASARDSARLQAGAYERAVADRDRYHQERDTFRAVWASAAPEAVLQPPRRPDPYAGPSPGPLPSYGAGAHAAPMRGGTSYKRVAMPPLEGTAEEPPRDSDVRRYPRYCPPRYLDSGHDGTH